MENASKALLIAAGVLIVILLIAFGMSIFNSTGDTSEDAQTVGTTISSSTSDAKIESILSLMDYKNQQVFHNYIQKNYGTKKLSANELKELYKLVVFRTKKLTGEERNTTTIYISGWHGDGAAIYWDNNDNLNTILEKVEEDKTYKISLDRRENEDYVTYSLVTRYAN